MSQITKPEFYDRFKCTAEQCPFTCCQGWDISIDTVTEGRWNEDPERTGYLLRYRKFKRNGKKKEGLLKLDAQNRCCHLDERGLCSIVTKFGDAYLPKTCRDFPRRCNESEDILEYSLSCTCPAVVDLLYETPDKLKLQKQNDNGNIPKQYLPEYRIRAVMIDLIQNSKFSLQNRILLIFHLLLQLEENRAVTDLLLVRYQDGQYLQRLIDQWCDLGIDFEDTYLETKELFLDISENYRKEKTYLKYLPDIYEFAQKLDALQAIHPWKEFLSEFNKYEQLLENVLVIKIFSNCVVSDPEEMLLSFQLIITEYLMLRYSVFLRWLKDRDNIFVGREDFEGMIPDQRQTDDNLGIEYGLLRDYIVVFSRIIEYNEDGIREFWEESFDAAIWEFGYLLLLVN